MRKIYDQTSFYRRFWAKSTTKILNQRLTGKRVKEKGPTSMKRAQKGKIHH